MPTTPQFGITYPCMGVPVTAADFASLATTTDTALGAVGFGSVPGTGEAYTVTHLPTGRGLGAVTTLPGVEGTLTYTLVPSSVVTGTGVTVNVGTGAFNVLSNGFYLASAVVGGAGDSTLTMTSQRIAVYVNANLYAAKKVRGFNPAFTSTIGSTYDFGVNLLNTDTLTFRFLWTGTGVLTGTASATVSLSLLSRT